jgi:hypothetical protein
MDHSMLERASCPFILEAKSQELKESDMCFQVHSCMLMQWLLLLFLEQVFYFDVGENRRGRFLKVCSVSLSCSGSFLSVQFSVKWTWDVRDLLGTLLLS